MDAVLYGTALMCNVCFGFDSWFDVTTVNIIPTDRSKVVRGFTVVRKRESYG